jgi:lauroyl/myristoyl acyltransferase
MHHGNWEWLAGLLYHFRSDTIGVARSAHHPLGQSILRWVRTFHRTPVYYDRDAILRASRQLRHGGLVAFLADQRPPTGGIPGQWLNQPTQVTPLPSLWSRSSSPALWTGQLSWSDRQLYHLDLLAYDPSALDSWSQCLDSDFLPWIRRDPTSHFGFFHRRLVSRETSTRIAHLSRT